MCVYIHLHMCIYIHIHIYIYIHIYIWPVLHFSISKLHLICVLPSSTNCPPIKQLVTHLFFYRIEKKSLKLIWQINSIRCKTIVVEKGWQRATSTDCACWDWQKLLWWQVCWSQTLHGPCRHRSRKLVRMGTWLRLKLEFVSHLPILVFVHWLTHWHIRY
jgi:hypothetical protein